ncbi:GspH/FimT family pseudopilin [uncultured Microbulbifer sp.]|uniref:GspH/FimT family pseudopilin n=1 Tax=uncultured Microbulbifer sp. TaxID=348147 RepID=UPI002607D0F6|nr:GspH/FimT family pseudopilin [uncultured Microbulbifer sp.]
MVYRQQGLTLIELMVTLAVLAIVIGIAVPSFSTMINNNRSLALGEELVSVMNYARSEAVKRGGRVSVCGSTDGVTCNGSWANNWLVVVDSAATDGAAAVSVEEVLRLWEVPGNNASVSATQNSTAVNFVRFNRLGVLGNSTGGAISLSASITGCAGDAARTVTVGLAGMLNVARSTSGCS